jgi:hypothetical protein
MTNTLQAGLPSASFGSLHSDAVEARIMDEMTRFIESNALSTGSPVQASETLPALTALYHAYFAVMNLIQQAAPDDLPTIGQIAEGITHDPDLSASWTKDQCQHLVVAVIGWSTFMFTYESGNQHQHSIVVQLDEPKQLSMNLKIASNRRPGALLRSFELLDELSDDIIIQDRLLYLATLNFWSLKNIGNLHIIWVPHISQHLMLDVATRTLYLFQYPTLCASQCQNGKMGQYFER